MLLLIIGLLIWIIAHLARSIAPDLRTTMQAKLGFGSKVVMALIILAALAFMIMGYRSADTIVLWSPPSWMTHVNNLLMVLALFIYFTTATKPGTAFIFGSVKNPQLTGFKIWALAHLLVNGDLKSVVLFGGLLVWAIIQVIASKRTQSLVDRTMAPISSPWVHLGLVAAAFIVIVLVHSLIGVSPFGSARVA